MIDTKHMQNIKMNKILAAVIGIILLGVIWNFFTGNITENKSVAQKVLDSGKIRLGYIIYPPLLMKDEKTGQLSGVSYDIVEEAAKKLNLKTEWAEEVGWGTAIEGLKTKRYDMTGTNMWENSSRAREAIFSDPIFFDTVGAYVNAGDKRIKPDLSNLNDPKFTISYLEGDTIQLIVTEDFPKAKHIILPQSTQYSDIFLTMITKKSDIVLADQSAASVFLKKKVGFIEKINTKPLRLYRDTYVFARGEDEMRDMWNVALQELINEGKIEKILDKYGVKENYVLNK